MISEKVISDAKFYNKLILIFFSSEDCDICNDLFDKVKELKISNRYYIFNIDSIEKSNYFIRLSRGIIPTITILSPELKILGIIESTDIKFIEDSLRKIFESYLKDFKGSDIPSFVPELDEPSQEIFYEIINRALENEPIDYRTIEFIKTFSTAHKEYEKIIKELNPANDMARYLIENNNINLQENYVFNISFLVNFGKEDKTKLLNFIDNNGEVFRSIKRETKGMLIDEANVGNTLLSLYNKTGYNEFLELSLKIFNYIKNNLMHEKGFRDCPPNDPITSIVFLEPLGNSEAALFLARLWAITDNEEARKLSELAIKSSYGGSKDIRVLSRIALSLIVLNERIKTSEKINIDDIRLSLQNISCKYEYDGKCYNSLEEIKPKFF
jgi:hypothetical protein